ncbi:putative diacylglycerol O-acyltransferase [Helianthus anomalus]
MWWFKLCRFGSAVLSGVTLMLCACINWLKLTSFVHTSYDMRSLVNSTDKGEAESTSSNIELFYDVDFNSLVYFMVAPTLCYQRSYPRTAFIRKGWVLRQLIKLVIFTGFMGFIIEQVSLSFLRLLQLFNLSLLCFQIVTLVNHEKSFLYLYTNLYLCLVSPKWQILLITLGKVLILVC